MIATEEGRESINPAGYASTVETIALPYLVY